jgi:hypothetical protein
VRPLPNVQPEVHRGFCKMLKIICFIEAYLCVLSIDKTDLRNWNSRNHGRIPEEGDGDTESEKCSWSNGNQSLVARV